MNETAADREYKFYILNSMAADTIRLEDPGYNEMELLKIAEWLLLEQRARSQLLNEFLSGSPAWEMLLALFVSHARGQIMTVSTLAGGVQCPWATAIRYINALRTENWLRASSPDADDLASIVVLTPQALERLATYMSSMLRSSQRML